MTDTDPKEDWIGIHPHWRMFGWIVTHPSKDGFHRLRYRKFTRRGADRLVRRLNRKTQREIQWRLESGEKVIYRPEWFVLGRIQDHPGRTK